MSPVDIIVACPQCNNRYTLKEELRGKTIRCPNSSCVAIFTVPSEVSNPVPAVPAQPTVLRPARKGTTEVGSVGGMIPILPSEIPLAQEAEPVAPEPVTPEPEAPARRSRTGTVGDLVPLLEGNPTVETDWSQAPPVRKKPTAPRPSKPSDTAQRPAAPATLRLPAFPSPAAECQGEAAASRKTQRIDPPPARQEPVVEPVVARSGDRATTPVEPVVARSGDRATTPVVARSPDPVVARSPDRATAEPAPKGEAPAEPPAETEGPRVLAPGDWQAPPPRRADKSGNRTPVAGTPVEKKAIPKGQTLLNHSTAPDGQVETHPEEHPDSPQSQRGKLWVRIGLAVVFLMMVGFGVTIWMLFRVTEAGLAELAMKEYQNQQFNSAADKFKQLAEQFSASDRVTEYRLLEELCRLRYQLEDKEIPPLAEALEKVNAFLKSLKQEGRAAVFKPYHADLGKSLMIRLGNLRDQAPKEKPTTPELLLTVLQVVKDVSALSEALTQDNVGQVRKDVVEINKAIVRYNREQDFLARLKPLVGRPSGASLRQAHRMIREAEEEGLPGISKNDKVTRLLQQIQDGHRDAVVYHREGAGLKVQARAEDSIDVLIVDPEVERSRLPAKADAPLVLAVVRGVLYACNSSTGKVRWATRVGIDTTTLPVRLPATPISPERILVISADSNTLTALDQEGQTVWQYHLGKACLGRPVIVGSRAFIPTFDGQIHEIELIKGTLLGRFQLGEGERLNSGGTCQDDLLYVPADEGCVYVLDINQKKCVAVLYTNHPSGSLRGEPILVPPDPPAPGYLVLTQTAGLDHMQLRVYGLPIRDPNAEPIALKRQPHVQGWSWFPARSDEEKIALLTDLGVMGLFGIRQARNHDSALFPQFPCGPEGLSLEPFVGGGKAARKTMGRAQVVAMQSDTFWVLVDGRLQRLEMGWKSDVGPRLVPAWKEPPLLGSPLHESQEREDRATGRNFLYLVTHALNRPACLMTAVDGGDKGEVLWQRQLGLVCQGEVVALQPPDGKGLPLLLAMDPGGALLSFDPTAYQKSDRPGWHRGGQKVAPGFDENRRFPPVFIRDDSGKTVWQVGCPGTAGSANEGQTLLIRKVNWRPGRRELEIERESKVILKAAPAGPPVRQGDHVLLPLENAKLVRIPLNAASPEATPGPDWRARRLGLETRGHVLALDQDRVLTYDGLGGLFCWNWILTAGDVYSKLPDRDTNTRGYLPPTLALKSRLTAAPLLVPAQGKEEKPRVCLAEASGWVRLLQVEEDGQLKEQRSWDLKDPVTAGPFLRVLPSGERRIGCIVKQSRLVWLDPDRDEPVWEYGGERPAPAVVGAAASAAIDPTEAIIGEPQLVKDFLLVADQGGRFLAIDPKDGKVRKQYKLRGNMSATVSPVSFGPDRAFAPITDGTVLLLPLQK